MKSIIIVCVWLVAVAATEAQQVAVQQPVLGTTSVRTTVSVPDRGSTHLGGVNSAQSNRQNYGPLPSGSSIGLARSASSMSAHVTIHDLRSMDEALLNSVPDSPVPSTIRGASRPNSVDAARPVMVSAAEKARKYERLAQKSELAGQSRVANLHWQMAAKYGSTVANEKLATLSEH